MKKTEIAEKYALRNEKQEELKVMLKHKMMDFKEYADLYRLVYYSMLERRKKFRKYGS